MAEPIKQKEYPVPEGKMTDICLASVGGRYVATDDVPFGSKMEVIGVAEHGNNDLYRAIVVNLAKNLIDCPRYTFGDLKGHPYNPTDVADTTLWENESRLSEFLRLRVSTFMLHNTDYLDMKWMPKYGAAYYQLDLEKHDIRSVEDRAHRVLADDLPPGRIELNVLAVLLSKPIEIYQVNPNSSHPTLAERIVPDDRQPCYKQPVYVYRTVEADGTFWYDAIRTRATHKEMYMERKDMEFYTAELLNEMDPIDVTQLQ